ncbi:MAG: hypothetical protein QM594_12300 [Niabella sp.]
MATKEEVGSFLSDFHQKLKIWEIRIRDDRGKNTQTLLNLEMSPMQRIKIIEGLSIDDYSQGPKPDTLNAGAPLWVFGKQVKNRMIYIKISMGPPDRSVICISFHEAEREMSFPFKENTL